MTLHFLGNVQLEPVRQALLGLEAPAFQVDLGGPGTFRLRGGRRILWIGAELSAPLSDLQRLVGARLRSLGFEPEQRPYLPHITLARLSALAPADIHTRFVEQALPDLERSFHCETFALYASQSNPEGPCYRVVQSYPLGR